MASFEFPKKLPKEWIKTIERNDRTDSEIDPNFGYETIGGSSLSAGNTIRSSVFTITENGTAQSITAYVNALAGTKIKCAIYLHSDSSLIAATEEWTVPSDQTGWHTFNFSSPPSLIANTVYCLAIWSNANNYIYYDTGETNQGHGQSLTYDSWPNPATFTHTNRKYSIYCTYTTGAILKEVTDSLSLSDIVLRNKTLLPITDTVGATDIILRNKTLTISDSVSSVDSVLGNKSLLIVTDAISLAEFVDVITGAIIKTIADAVGLADMAKVSKTLNVSDALSLVDVVHTPSRVLQTLDSVGLADNIIVDKVLQITETINLVEIIQVGVGGVKKTKLFLILGDLAVQLTGN